MCDQREKLIGYLYDDCEPSERAAIQQHLDECDVCRGEIAALRAVREDLRSWEVPEHGSVWRPFAAAPKPSVWQEMPRWAMAAAAGLVMMTGAAGGAVTYAFMPQPEATVQTVQAPASTPAASVAEVAALREQIAVLRRELGAVDMRVSLASSREIPADMEAALHKAFDRQITDLRAVTDKQLDVIQQIRNNQDRYEMKFNIRHADLQKGIASLAAALEQGK